MEKNHNILQTLVDNIKQLPGIGPKAAQRIAFYLSISNKKLANELRLSLESALKEINLCEECNNFSFNLICDVCNLSNRDQKKLCIVEMPSDLQNIENTNFYNGKYYILMGRLSPINGIGPEQLKIEKLKKNIEKKDKSVKGFNIGTNSGKAAGQSINHCHIHLIPRRSNDVKNPQGGVRAVISSKQHYVRKK